MAFTQSSTDPETTQPTSADRTPMSSVDRSWLRMESPENPMMISAVLIFEEPLSISRLKRTLDERFLTFRRFRQKVVQQGEKAYWQDDPLFHIDNHVHRIALAGDAGKQELQSLVSDMNSTSLDFRRPLWQIHYIDQYDGGCALLIRIHHCIADGISLVRVLLSLTDRKSEPAVRQIRPHSAKPPAARPGNALGRITRRFMQTGQAAMDQGSLFLKSLRTEPDYPMKLATTAGNISLELLKLGLAPAEPKTCLNPKLSGRKQVAWAEPLSLAEVKDCARALKGTANDVLLCAAAGALQRHFSNSGETPPESGIRVAVPFNLRPLHQPIETLGNQFGLVLVTLPVEVTCPIMRFRQIQHNMNQLKRSYQAQVTYSLLDLFGRGPDVIERRALSLLSSKASAVLTNVPGPKEAVYLAGAKLRQPMFWVPQSGNIGIGLSIFSYAGTVQFGITIDKSIPVDPESAMEYFRDSFRELYNSALEKQQESDEQTFTALEVG
ncbi:wax ester/triacylglycerol synthase family O-acyltransferase [Marinobacter sp. CHS3-4]|uniref:wax ester/triacylglycerol synthase family O-acyltransferase n=1 Tax=Marinobacter sp. CHS3-4 TaxID=3045174 RepID=UPI0024B6099E|nr:wax ester/triacylglycerol synthase family O-acyltransferase [Marinobacter sp. CHS3-4]MDI9244365.1 wax ester/triacylglycerol synthase family O-acyltransferase [Marinobacter sp. CHS3-4]